MSVEDKQKLEEYGKEYRKNQCQSFSKKERQKIEKCMKEYMIEHRKNWSKVQEDTITYLLDYLVYQIKLIIR